MDRTDTLKIDKDCHVPTELEQQYIQNAITILRKHRLRVEWVKATRTRHGRHYYIHIAPSIDASTTNRLQYLLGDDSKRVSLNQARINGGCQSGTSSSSQSAEGSEQSTREQNPANDF